MADAFVDKEISLNLWDLGLESTFEALGHRVTVRTTRPVKSNRPAVPSPLTITISVTAAGPAPALSCTLRNADARADRGCAARVLHAASR
jgi:hypothetical protein